MAWWIWLLAALVLGLIEVSTMTFIILWIAVAAFLTGILSAVTDSVVIQVGLFVVASVVLLIITRPLARRWRKTKPFRNQVDTLVGEHGVVVQPAGDTPFAMARIRGELWSVRCELPLEAGDTVKVTGIGAVLEVQKTD